nr:BspA family leucine-rich repeat surface protein [Mycoplasmopsis bovis]
MFNGALEFNQPLNFDTSNVKIWAICFDNAKEIQLRVKFSNTRNVKDMSGMFCLCKAFNQHWFWYKKF